MCVLFSAFFSRVAISADEAISVRFLNASLLSNGNRTFGSELVTNPVYNATGSRIVVQEIQLHLGEIRTPTTKHAMTIYEVLTQSSTVPSSFFF